MWYNARHASCVSGPRTRRVSHSKPFNFRQRRSPTAAFCRRGELAERDPVKCVPRRFGDNYELTKHLSSRTRCLPGTPRAVCGRPNDHGQLVARRHGPQHDCHRQNDYECGYRPGDGGTRQWRQEAPFDHSSSEAPEAPTDGGGVSGWQSRIGLSRRAQELCCRASGTKRTLFG